MFKINFFRRIKSLQFIFKPSYWTMLYEYDLGWDIILNNLLDNHDFTEISKFTASLGGCKIWIANKPYASMMPKYFEFRASRLTIQRAIRKLQQNRRFWCKEGNNFGETNA